MTCSFVCMLGDLIYTEGEWLLTTRWILLQEYSHRNECWGVLVFKVFFAIHTQGPPPPPSTPTQPKTATPTFFICLVSFYRYPVYSLYELDAIITCQQTYHPVLLHHKIYAWLKIYRNTSSWGIKRNESFVQNKCRVCETNWLVCIHNRNSSHSLGIQGTTLVMP